MGLDVRESSIANEGKMFEFIHHVRILVHDADAMAEYIEENFGMTPVKVEVYPARGMKNAIYHLQGRPNQRGIY